MKQKFSGKIVRSGETKPLEGRTSGAVGKPSYRVSECMIVLHKSDVDAMTLKTNERLRNGRKAIPGKSAVRTAKTMVPTS